MELKTLTVEDVLAIHETLVSDFAATGDPISPPGVKSLDLLHSAVHRQHTGYEKTMKYPDPVSNAATLMYGVCCDHPFFNGNKRTALVAMLVHLDFNKLTLFQTSQADLYKMIIGVASHTFGLKIDPRKDRSEPKRQSSDEEVAAVSAWLSKRASRVVRGEKPITFRDFRRILESFGYTFDSPQNNYIDIVREEEEHVGVLRKRTRVVKKRIGNIPYPGENQEVGVKLVKRVRQLCHLSEEHGVDSASFYDRAAVIDAFVNKYRTLLRRLARR